MCIEGIDFGVRFAVDHRRLIHLFQQDRARISTTRDSTKTHYMMWLEQYLRQESAVRVRLINYGMGGTLTGSKPEKTREIVRMMRVIWDLTPPTEPIVYVRPLELSDHFMHYFQSLYRPHLEFLDPRLKINAQNHIVEGDDDNDSLPDLVEQPQRQPDYDPHWIDHLVQTDPFVLFQNNPEQPIDAIHRQNLFRDFDMPALNIVEPETILISLSKDKWVHGDDVCSICLINEPFIQTHCHHAFCGCITTYIMRYQHMECPMCRQAITALTLYDKRCFETLKSVECLFPHHVAFVE